MNPACKENINSPECQQWISEVVEHCNRLLADKQLEFWNDWWLHHQQAPSYQVPHLMSAYECHSLRNEIEQAMATAVSQAPELRFHLEHMDSNWRAVLIIFLIVAGLSIIGCMIWVLDGTLRRIARPVAKDCERQRVEFRKCKSSPRSFNSFSRPCAQRSDSCRTERIVVPSSERRAGKR